MAIATPSDYHRIISPELIIPRDVSVSIPVGLLACQRDPLLKELRTTVVSCVLHQANAQPSQKSDPLNGQPSKKKNKDKNASSSREPLYEVILHDTILFPEGGGQPTDTGILETKDGIFDVKEIRRHGGHAVHYVQATRHLEAGEEVRVTLGEVGFQRRLDHMCMHTSQHLLSALLETHLQLPTLSWALTTYPTPSYVELPRALTEGEISSIQSMAHNLAYEGRSVHIEVEPLDAENHPGVSVLESGRTVGKALPQDYTGGVKRTVIIDGVDRNPCCGTHLPSLANLQLFLLPQTESLTRGNSSSSRLFFLCGPRLHAHLASSHALLTATAGIMSCGPPLVPERVSQAIEERRRVTRRAEELEHELARSIAETLLAELQDNGTLDGGPFVKHYHRVDDPANALTFLQSISSSFLSLIPDGATPFTIVLSSSPASQTPSSTTSVLLLSSDEKLVKVVGDELKTVLGVKGGGKGTRWSGKWTGVWKDNKEGDVVNKTLDKVHSQKS